MKIRVLFILRAGVVYSTGHMFFSKKTSAKKGRLRFTGKEEILLLLS